MGEPLELDIQPIDREVYAGRLREFLPPRIIDVHTHVWLDEHLAEPAGPSRTVTWPARVAATQSVEVLLETYRRLLPDQSVTPLIFGNPLGGGCVDAGNRYVAQAARACHLPAMLLSRPEWSADELRRRLSGGPFCGAKVYLSFAPAQLDAGQISVFDFLPPHQLDVFDRLGLAVMLHLPRPGRLRDPVNLEQLLRIERDWPGARILVAHVGRAYCPEDIGDAFDVLAPTRRLTFDISANTNETVFAALIRAVGPRRILFGSDLPIVRMRMRRVCEGGRYVNIVPPGLYGDVSGDPNMRECDPSEAGRLTFFLYEQLDAFRRAAAACELSGDDLTDVFLHNARRLLRPHWTDPRSER